jgi:hypothetical protein
VLARPLYALPQPAFPVGRTPQADPAVLAEYERCVRVLFEDVPELALDEEERPLPVTLTLGITAEALFEQYELELAEARRTLGQSEDAEQEAAYLGWLSKLAGQTARIAACLHAASEWTSGVTANHSIDLSTVTAAIEIARYFHRHALIAFGLMGELPEQRRAASILSWLRDRDPDVPVTVRDVHRSRGKGTSAEQVKTALQLLEQHGYVRLERQPISPRGGRPSERVHVNPALKHTSIRPDETDETEAAQGSVGSVGPDGGVFGEAALEHTDPACTSESGWRAHDRRWRCSTCNPPAFPGEIVEERG